MSPNKFSDADVARGERAARKLIKELGIDHPTETAIENIAFLRGVVVRDAPMRGSQGRLTRIGAKAIATVSDKCIYVPQRRYVIAHELGHFEIHPNKNDLALCDETKISELYDSGTEKEANAFASELLMPTVLWTKLTDVKSPSLDIVAKLAADFQVSFTAAAIRFAKICPERCAVVFAQNSKVAWAALGPEFGHYVCRDGKLDSYTLASDYFNKGYVTQSPEEVKARAWINNTRIGRDDYLVEHCRVIPSLKATLSLLWIRPDESF